MNFGGGFQKVVFRRISGPALIPILVLAIPVLLVVGVLGISLLGFAAVSGLLRNSKNRTTQPDSFGRRNSDAIREWEKDSDIIDVQSVVLTKHRSTED